MLTDILLQLGMALVTVFMFLVMYDIPQKALVKLRSLRGRTGARSKRHFVQGAQLLAQAQSLARSSKDQPAASAIAKSAAEEADRAIALDPRDAAAHILKALALDLQGFRTSALDSLDVALSPLAAPSLSGEERGDALFKRAELRAAMSQGVDSVVADLVESVRLRSDNPKAFCDLGECYEKKGMKEDAIKAYEDAIRVEPRAQVAREALERLSS